MMKTFKGLKVPEFKLPETQSEWCHMMTDLPDCNALKCSECIYGQKTSEIFKEWKLSNKDKDAK
jgi:hypothetical protein